MVNHLKKQIEDGLFKPGEKLPSERLLQQELSVSRFTLREALARLSALGIIKTIHGKGTIVAREVSGATLADAFIPLFANRCVKDVIDFFEARLLIEGEAASLSARRRSDEDLKRFQSILADSREAIDDPNRYGELDFLFHMQIAQSSGNVFIQSMMGCLNAYTRRYTRVIAHAEASRKASFVAHEEIYDCILNWDAAQAGVVTRKHLNRMVTILQQLGRQEQTANRGGGLKSVLELLKQKEEASLKLEPAWEEATAK